LRNTFLIEKDVSVVVQKPNDFRSVSLAVRGHFCIYIGTAPGLRMDMHRASTENDCLKHAIRPIGIDWFQNIKEFHQSHAQSRFRLNDRVISLLQKHKQASSGICLSLSRYRNTNR
jgi:hypothetical protein